MIPTLRRFGLMGLVMASLLLGSVLPAAARDRDDKCERRIRNAENKLREAVQRHGENSKQAHKRHEKLEEVRRHCEHRDRDHDHDHH